MIFLKKKLDKKENPRKGFVLLTTFSILIILGVLASFLVGLILGEWRIALSQREGFKAFYLAEAGIDDAVFRVKNDALLRSDFLNGTLNTNFVRDPAFTSQGRYEVSLSSLGPGEASVVSSGYFSFWGTSARRVIKAKLIRGTNPQPLWDKALYSLQDINFAASLFNISGNIYAGRDIDVWIFSSISVEGDAEAMIRINIASFSSLSVTGEFHARNYPPPPSFIEMPQIDFDSPNPNSLLSKATAIYTEREFRDLLRDNPNLTLSGIIYVKGNINLKKDQKLTINGLLVADGSIQVGMPEGGPGEGSYLVVNDPGSNQLCGLLAKGKIQAGIHTRQFSIQGLVYSNDEVRMMHFSPSVSVNGGIITRSFSSLNLWSEVQIILNQERISRILQLENSEAPTVKVDHWEEEY